MVRHGEVSIVASCTLSIWAATLLEVGPGVAVELGVAAEHGVDTLFQAGELGVGDRLTVFRGGRIAEGQPR